MAEAYKKRITLENLENKKNDVEVKRVEKVDKLIETLAEHIADKIFSGKESNQEISEKTKALAELISARASML